MSEQYEQGHRDGYQAGHKDGREATEKAVAEMAWERATEDMNVIYERAKYDAKEEAERQSDVEYRRKARELIMEYEAKEKAFYSRERFQKQIEDAKELATIAAYKAVWDAAKSRVVKGGAAKWARDEAVRIQSERGKRKGYRNDG